MGKMFLNIKRILHSVTTKTILLMIACVLPLNIFVIWEAVNINKYTQNEISLTTKNVADVYINSLDNVMENSDYLIFDLANNNSDFLTLKKEENNSDYENARYRCFWIMQNRTELRSEGDALFFYMSNKKDLLLAVSKKYSLEKNSLEKYFQNEEKFDISYKWKIIEIEGKQWLIRIMKNKNIYYGSLINLDTLKSEISNSISYKTSYINFNEKSFINESNKIAVSSQSEKADLKLNISISKSEVMNNLSWVSKGSFILAFIFLAMIPILFFYLRKTLIKPIRILNHAHYQIQIGNQNFRITQKANTFELESSYESFNNMAENIQKLKIENIEKELVKNQMELKNLQLQIRPHFLLNTFNMIFILNEQKNNESVKELILYLSEYFRYIYRSKKELELFEKELHLIEGYVNAASIRYPNKIRINYQIEPNVLMIKVPPLLIHNFIENIINHALVPDKVINITLLAYFEEGIVNFQISDDGMGIEKEILKEINEEYYRSNDDRVHVGIQNSIRRLKYFYGENAKIIFESEVGKGTLVTLTFPYSIEEDLYESVNS